MSQLKIKQLIEKHLIPSGQFIYGFADLRHHIGLEFNDYPFAVSIGRKLDDTIVNGIAEGPTLIYLQHYKQVNRELSEITTKIKEDFKNENIGCICIEPTVVIDDNEKVKKTLTADFSHKMAATCAGLGWIGKSDLFISHRFGPRLRLVSLLINTEVIPLASPVLKSKCGKCSVCVDNCPAKAANGKLWNTTVHRDEFFNAFSCRKKCREISGLRLNSNTPVCGICVSVCPVGQKTSVKKD